MPNEGAKETDFTADDAAEAMEAINGVTHAGSEIYGNFSDVFEQELVDAGWVQDEENEHHWTREDDMPDGDMTAPDMPETDMPGAV